MLVHVMLFCKSFKLSLLIFLPPYFYGMNSTALSWSSLSLSSASSSLLLNAYIRIFVQIFISVISAWYFFILIFSFCWNFHFVHALFSWALWVSRFMTIILNLLSHKSSTLILFWGFILFLHLEHITLFLQLFDLCCFLCIRWNSSPNLKCLVSCKRISLLFNLP